MWLENDIRDHAEILIDSILIDLEVAKVEWWCLPTRRASIVNRNGENLRKSTNEKCEHQPVETTTSFTEQKKRRWDSADEIVITLGLNFCDGGCINMH